LWASDCEPVCKECFDDAADDIIDTYKNETTKAVIPDFYPIMEREGFVCYSPDEYCKVFETGFHPGQNDSPIDVAKDIKTNLPEHEFMFKIDSVGQFDLHWSVYIRKAA